jgi:Immunoglobulin I-set domain/Immunoglobulin domain
VKFRIQKYSLLLAALLQVLPVVKNFFANPAAANTFAFILKWGIGTAATMVAVDAVSGATSSFTSPSSFSGATGNFFSNNVVVSIGGGNTASRSDYFLVNNSTDTSPTLTNHQSTTVAMPPGLAFQSSWVNGASTIGGFISGTPTTAGTYPITVTCVSPGNASLSQNITITITGQSGPTAPSIVTQPSPTNAILGSNASFTVAASGTSPLVYLWQKGGTALSNGGRVSGSTTTTLTIASVTNSDVANYSVVVSNSAGSVTSSPAALGVIIPPKVTTQPSNNTVIAGGNVSFSVTASGTAPLSYQWLFNGGNISGQTSATLSLINVTTNNAGNYSVLVANAGGSVVSSNATLVVNVPPFISAQPTNATVFGGASVVFASSAGGNGPLFYQWLKNNSPLGDGGNIVGSQSNVLSITSVTTNDVGIYNLTVTNAYGSITSSNAALVVNLSPVITASPTNQDLVKGSNTVLNVSVTGSSPLKYQWLFNSKNITAATNAVLALNAVTTNNSGNYSVIVTNLFGRATSAVAIVKIFVSPIFTLQASNRWAKAGATNLFIAAASGTAPLTWQWFKDGSPLSDGGNISGTQSNVLAITALSTNDNAAYSLTVSNFAGLATSSNAVLKVFDRPLVLSSPSNLWVVVSNPATLTVVAAGTDPLHYQWRKAGVNIVNATNQSFSLASAKTNDSAAYSVVVTNFAGSVTSAPAALTVFVPPVFSLQASNRVVAASSNTVFRAAATGTAPLNYQWFKDSVALTNGGNISGVNSNVLTVANISANDVGAYSLVVSNFAAAITSSNAQLTLKGAVAAVLHQDSVSTTVSDVFAAPLLQISADKVNGVMLQFQTTANASFVIQTSSDLLNWTDSATNSADANGLFQFTEPPSDSPTKFYRVHTAQ